MRIVLSASEMQCLQEPVNGEGGFQMLLRGFQEKLQDNGTLDLSADELEKIRRYAHDYKSGGYENKLKAIFEKHYGIL